MESIEGMSQRTSKVAKVNDQGGRGHRTPNIPRLDELCYDNTKTGGTWMVPQGLENQDLKKICKMCSESSSNSNVVIKKI